VGLGIETLDLMVESAFHAKVTIAIDGVLDVVAMFPLIPGQVMELDEETLGPALARFPAVVPVVVALLELTPRGGEKALQQVLPADGGLRCGGPVDCIVLEVGKSEGTVAPPVEVGEQGRLNAGVGVGLLKVGRQLINAFVPHIIGTFGSAPKHMGGVLGSAAPGALIVILIFPKDEGLAHAAI